MAMDTDEQHDYNRRRETEKAGVGWRKAVVDEPALPLVVLLRRDGPQVRFQTAIYFHYASVNVHALPTSIDFI